MATILLFTISLAQACTVSTTTSNPTTGQTVSFNVVTQGDEGRIDRLCEAGGALATDVNSPFTCTYSNTGSKTVTVIAYGLEFDSETNLRNCSTTLSVSAASSPNQAPVATITSPTGSQLVPAGRPFTISGTATDTDGDISSVEVQVASAPESCGDDQWRPATLVGSGSSVTWTRNWNPPANLFCTINVRANDNSSAQSTQASFSFRTGGELSTGGGSSAACVQSCINRVRISCPGGVRRDVSCCPGSEQSDCTAVCVGQRYRAPSCSVGGGGNTCTYGTPAFVTGQCGFGPTCQIVGNAATTTGTTAGLTLRYNNFLETPPGSVSLDCGNGVSRTLTCSGSSGNCSTTCSYTTSGSFSPRAVIQGVTCNGPTLTVSGGSTTTQTGSQGQTSGQTQNRQNTTTRRTTNVLTCSLAAPANAETGDRVEIRLTFNGAALSPGPTTINCGDGASVTAPGCISGVTGSGQCVAGCVYSVPGIFSVTSSIRGVRCSEASVNITQGEETETSSSAFSTNEASINISNFATSPSVILANVATRVTALVRSDQAVISAVCTPIGDQQRSCSCTLSSTTEPNPVVDCNVEPPVGGRYQITFTGQDGKTKNAEVTLTPGESGTIEVINRPSDNYSLYLIGLIIGIIAVALGYWFVQRLTAASTYKSNLYKRREQVLKEIDYTKASYMKGQLGQPQFQKIYNDKQKELTETNAKIAEAEKKK